MGQIDRTGIDSIDLFTILARLTKEAWHLASFSRASGGFSEIRIKDGMRARIIAVYPQTEFTKLQPKWLPDSVLNDAAYGRTDIRRRAIATRQVQCVGDVTREPDCLGCQPTTRAALAIPIKVGEEVIGVLTVEHTQSNAFDLTAQRLLESLAIQVRLALQSVWRDERWWLSMPSAKATTDVAWLGMSNAAWRHRIGNDTTTILDHVQLLRFELDENMSGDQLRQRLDIIDKLVRKIQGASITGSRENRESFESISINDWLGIHIAQLWRREPYKSVPCELNLDTSQIFNVKVSSDWLQTAVDIIIDNAVESMALSMTQKLIIITKKLNRGIEVSICDTGQGIPMGVLSQLFHHPIAKSTESKGAGIGLLLVQMILQKFGGDIYVESTGSLGTTMAFWLPLDNDNLG